MSYTIPTNSFIQAYSAPIDNCAEEISLCLPVYDVNDLAFMFRINSNAGSDVFVKLIKGGVAVGTPKQMGLVQQTIGPYDYYYINNISDMEFETEIEEGECFYLRIYSMQEGDPFELNLFQTSCFQKIADPCWTSVIKYRCNENSFGLYYNVDNGAGNLISSFYNKIRLPFYLKEPQFPVTRNVFIKSDGSRKKLSARIANEYMVGTDYMPKAWHEKLIVALEHDELFITNTNSGFTDQAFSQEGSYDINWQKFLDYPTAPAAFKLMKTPYYNVNSNCQ